MSIVLLSYSKTVIHLTSNCRDLLVRRNFSRYYHASHQHNKEERKKILEKIEEKFPVIKNTKEKIPFYQRKYNTVNRYVFSKFFDYIKNYNKILEQRFPRAFKAYRYFMGGVNNFFYDMKAYLMIVRKLSGPGNMIVSELSRREMEIYYYMPREMRKAAPTLILASMPGLFYAILPLSYMYPGVFLTHHFWTDDEKVKFRKRDLLKRLKQHRPIFRVLQYELAKFSSNPLHDKCVSALGMIGSGVHPSREMILQMKELFRDDTEPYSLSKLGSTHVAYLLRLHMLHKGFYRRRRLEKFAWILLQMDKAIIREGGVNAIPANELELCCYMRGLNTSDMNENDMRSWLEEWVRVTSGIVDKSLASLILHCPIFLSYNHPSNWALLHPSKEK